MKRWVSLILILALGLGVAACSTAKYRYEKESDTMLMFSSSDADLDHFLNDFLHRHLRYDDYRIGDLDLGSSVMFNKEWESMSLLWFDSTDRALPDNRISVLERFLNNIPVDKFGYTWQAFDTLQPATGGPTTYFGQGWPFPDYTQSASESKGFEFNPETVSSDGEWKAAEVTGGVEKDLAANIANGLLTVKASGAKQINIYSPQMRINTEHAPFLEVDIRLSDANHFGYESDIDDIYICWQTEEGGDQWFKVSQKEWATIPTMPESSWNKYLYFPLYLHPDWGTNKTVTALKVEVAAKKDVEFSGTAALNFIRANYDTRHSNNAELLLRSGKLHYEFTGDSRILSQNLNRYRMATQFLLTHLKGESGLLDLGYMPGHDGLSGVGHGIGNGYWDIFSSAQVSFYANIYFYRALLSMAYLEKAAEDLALDIQKPTVVGADNISVIPYTQTSATLYALAEKVRENICRKVSDGGFWDEEKGRFVEGVVNGTVIDYGFINFNLEAIESGIPTQQQSERIMEWISGERVIEEDLEAGERNFASGKNGTYDEETGEGDYGIYDFEFAPRTTTVKNYNQYNWEWGGTTPFGGQVQDGGAVMYLSYYDIASRIISRGSDDAFERLKEIQLWYNKVEKSAKSQGVGVDLPNDQFYRVYYDELGIPMQGDNVAGGIGLDAEFLESALLYASVPFGFFGLSGTTDGTLCVAPSLPSSLQYWKMENLLYRGVRYDLTIGEDFVQIDSVRGDTDGLAVEIAFPIRKDYKIFSDGSQIKQSDIRTDGEKVYVKVPFHAQKISIK